MGSLRSVGRGTLFAAWAAHWFMACAEGPAALSTTSSATGTSSSTTEPTVATTSTSTVTTAQPTTGEPPPTSTADATTGSSTGAGASTGTSTGTTDATDTTDTSGTTGTTETTGAAGPQLRVEPAMAQLEIAGGWSFPVQFTAYLGDGVDTPVVAEWSIDDAALGRITRYGGSFSARNTAAGPVQVSAEYDGQLATAALEVVLVDDHPVCPPRPPLTDGALAPGAFVRVVAPEYAGTGVHHGVYLPPDWSPGRQYPVIVETPCNKYGAFTGKVEDTRLAYHIAGCRNYVWIVLPYIKAQANLDYGWGELDANLAYWQQNVRRTLEAVGGDPGAVIVGGFSRGAIGAGYVGLHNDAIADAWLGFFLHSHADVVSNLTPDGGAGSAARMARVAGRASWLSWGAVGDGGVVNSLKGVDLLESLGYPVTTLAVPKVGHTDVWSIDDEPSRALAQAWLFATVAARPGTGAVYGRVTDAQAQGVPGVRVEAGPLHFATTDAAGYYALRGLMHGPRAVTCLDPACSGPHAIDVANVDIDDIDFVIAP
jgi:hypothetical protein